MDFLLYLCRKFSALLKNCFVSVCALPFFDRRHARLAITVQTASTQHRERIGVIPYPTPPYIYYKYISRDFNKCPKKLCKYRQTGS